jgi:predicted Kef-type K+ transport protein
MSASSELFGFSVFFGALYLGIVLQCWIAVAKSSHCLRKREITDVCFFNVLLGAFALARVVEMVLSLLDAHRFDDDVRGGLELSFVFSL